MMTSSNAVVVAGVAFHEKLIAAGAPSQLVISKGTCHSAEIFGALVPDVAADNAARLAAFARSL